MTTPNALGCISTDEHGRVVLSDDQLREIESSFVPVGGGNTSNQTCTNERACDGSYNTGCTNILRCNGASNSGCAPKEDKEK